MTGEPPVSIDDYLQVAVAPYLSARLIDNEGWQRIRRWSLLLPGAMTEFFGFEIRLGTLDALADFLVCSDRDGIAKTATIRVCEESPSFWRPLNPFFNSWTDPASNIYKNVHNFWLEFDASRSEEVCLPGVFFGASDLFANKAGQSGWLIQDAVPLIAGKNLNEKERECIARCLFNLPEGAFLFQIGRMLSRPLDATRICVRGLRAEIMPAYLETLQWPGSIGRIRDLLGWLSPASARVDVDLDAADEIMPRIGLECYFNSGPQLIGFARALQERGLAETAKINAVLSWNGIVHERVNRARWPRDLAAVSDLLEGRASSVFLRWLHHIKVVLSPDGDLEAKAYLAVSHHWLAPDEFRAIIANIPAMQAAR